MSLLARLNHVKQGTKLTVYGWIREAETELSIDNIPPLISALCILYFDEDEIFEFTGKGVIISDNKKCISSGRGSGFLSLSNQNYGSIQIPSMSGAVCQWDIRINKMRQIVSIFVGISSLVTPDPKEPLHTDGGHHYLIHDSDRKYNNGARWIPYKAVFAEGDKVSVRLDLTKRQIRFYVNDEDQGVAYYDIVTKNNVTYRLMISLGVFVEAEILNFTRFY